MSYICDICGKSNMRGNLVSHSKQRMHRLFKPNLHSARAIVSGVVKKLLVCTKCLRKLKRPIKVTSVTPIKPVTPVTTAVQVKEKQEEIKEVVVETPKTEQAPKEMKVKQTTVAELMKETKKSGVAPKTKGKKNSKK